MKKIKKLFISVLTICTMLSLTKNVQALELNKNRQALELNKNVQALQLNEDVLNNLIDKVEAYDYAPTSDFGNQVELTTTTTSAQASVLNENVLNNSIEKVEAYAYAPTSDFGNQVKIIGIKVQNGLNLNLLKASDFHIETSKVVNGVTKISKQSIKSIITRGNIIVFRFDPFSYNQTFNIVCDADSQLNFSKKDIKFNLGDVDKFVKGTYEGTNSNETLDYRLFVPKTNRKVPLILTLHGAGAIGRDNEAQLTQNDMATGFASNKAQVINKAYVVAPQLPTNVTDPAYQKKVQSALIEIIKELENKYPNIDKSRIYVTGLSYGGSGTWGLITSYPDVFAAAMPIAGQGDVSLMEKIKDVPIWTFHATNDKVLPVSETKKLVNRLRELGSNVQFTEYSTQDMINAGVPVNEDAIYTHFAWVPAYNNQNAINWLFKQKK